MKADKNLLLLIIYSLLLISVLSVRLLKEENSEGECNGDTCDNENNEGGVDYSNIAESKIRKENTPHSKVLLPIRRIGTSNMEMGVAPCGGVQKKASNTLTTKGSSINFIWEIMVPENTGNCTVKISAGLQNEENFELLKPVDGEINEDGSFACGREKGFETKEFILPEDYVCDGCTLQWKWTSSYGDIYSCSDIIINGGELSKCMGKCLNGGSCFNGKCLCRKGFDGEFCEEEGGQSSKAWIWILLGSILLLGGVGFLLYKFWPKIKSLFKNTTSWTKNDKEKDSLPFHEQDPKENEFDSKQLEENSKYKNSQ